MITQPYLDDIDLGDVLAKVKAVDGRESHVSAMMDAYDLTEIEAVSWTRHLYSVWGAIEADFLYSGSEFVKPSVRALLQFPDDRL